MMMESNTEFRNIKTINLIHDMNGDRIILKILAPNSIFTSHFK